MTQPPARPIHRMPFGAEVLEDGRVRFRLWAPAQGSVELLLQDAGDVLPMRRDPEGWFEVTAAATAIGTGYSFVLETGERVPDPAARAQVEDVHGASLVIDPRSYAWRNPSWPGRPWRETVLYELHVGTFTPEGTFEGVERRLDHLVETGVTALELMPVADFSGGRGWGYDGVLPFAPERAYGRPDDLKSLVDAAHDRELMVFLDVVYNHFGPEGNYLHLYAPDFFDDSRATPWGKGIAFEQPPVREFYVNNALYWLREFRFDGLRFDAVDWIRDRDGTGFLKELARAVRERIAQEEPARFIHLVLEHDANDAELLARDEDGRPVHFDAQWNDDWHHTAHTLLTGEADGYYADYARDADQRLARALATGFVYQGEPSGYRDGRRRGGPSAHLPPTAFVNFLQNHDQIGNRAFGERLRVLADPQALESFTAALLLAPQIPLLFMGEEWGETRPFCYFCDFRDALADAVREGRRNEFRRFDRFASPEARAEIPDPNARSTFESSALDWSLRETEEHASTLGLVRRLLALRRERIVPLLDGMPGGAGEAASVPEGVVRVRWRTAAGGTLSLDLNTTAEPVEVPSAPSGEVILALPEDAAGEAGRLPPHAVVWRFAAASG